MAGSCTRAASATAQVKIKIFFAMLMLKVRVSCRAAASAAKAQATGAVALQFARDDREPAIALNQHWRSVSEKAPLQDQLGK